jgi:hypothetical protein
LLQSEKEGIFSLLIVGIEEQIYKTEHAGKEECKCR